MLKHLLLLAFLFSSAYSALAANGDTTWVDVYDDLTMKWYERYYDNGQFPDDDRTYREVNMHFTLSCPSSGCSDWDYTVLIKAIRLTGEIDSTVSMLDTVSTNPLVVDTTWNIFNVKESIELGRMITPYAGYMARNQLGFSNNEWKHEYRFDVTDYAMLLKGDTEFEVFYQGWSSGFNVDLAFEMIEGTPPRDIVKIENVYNPGGYNYIDPDAFEMNAMPVKDVQLAAGATDMTLHFIPSGHGFVNSLNCAEFCIRSYHVMSQAGEFASAAMWRNDCAYNPIYPQAGTWVYNRANWCPGTKTVRFEHEITPMIEGDKIPDFNIDISRYNYTVPPGEVPANYNLSSVILHHAGFNHQVDAKLEDILQPSNKDKHQRYNPSCNTAMIQVKNTGGQPLTELTFEYGVEGGTPYTYEWTGNIEPMKHAVIEMPFSEAQAYTGSTELTFYTHIVSANQQADEYADNDMIKSNYTPVDQLSGEISFFMQTNNAANEISWRLYDSEGTVVAGDSNYLFQTTKLYELADIVEPGNCYHLQIKDSGEDGLFFPFNNDGDGEIALYENTDNGLEIVKPFLDNFGSQLDYFFSFDEVVSTRQPIASEPLGIYPTPASNNWNVRLPVEGDWTIGVYSMDGKLVQEEKTTNTRDWSSNTNSLNNGIYVVKASNGKTIYVNKLIVQKP